MTRTAMIVVPPAREHLNHGGALANAREKRPSAIRSQRGNGGGARALAAPGGTDTHLCQPRSDYRNFDKAHRLHGCFQACPDFLRACLERTSRTVNDQVPDPLSVRSPHCTAHSGPLAGWTLTVPARASWRLQRAVSQRIFFLSENLSPNSIPCRSTVTWSGQYL